MEAAQLARAADKSGASVGSIMIPFRIFERMLNASSFDALFEPASPFGRHDLTVWTYVLEELYYHPVLLKDVKIMRRERRNEIKVQEFVKDKRKRLKRYKLIAWSKYLRRRARCRYLVIGMVVRFHVTNLTTSFFRWLREVEGATLICDVEKSTKVKESKNGRCAY